MSRAVRRARGGPYDPQWRRWVRFLLSRALWEFDERTLRWDHKHGVNEIFEHMAGKPTRPRPRQRSTR